MPALQRTYRRLIDLMSGLAGAIIVLMVVVILLDVACRTVGIRIPPFAETFVEYGIVYATLLSAPFLVRERVHVQVEALMSLIPPALRLGVEKAIYAVSVAACLAVVWLSTDLLLQAVASGRIDVRGIDVPLWVLMLPFPPCFALVAVEFARYLFTSATYFTGIGKGDGL